MLLPRVVPLLVAFLALALPSLLSADSPPASTPVPAPSLPPGLYARFDTPRGVIVAELFFREAPLTVANFVGLAEGTLGPRPGTPYFDGLAFHRVVPGFVIQGGDPLGTGEGGPGYEFPDEVRPGLRHDGSGVLSMANGGPDTNGSQFFITLGDCTRLNYLHSVFGRVVSGHDIPASIQKGDTMRVSILRLGDTARSFAADRRSFESACAAAPRFRAGLEEGPGAAFQDPDGLLPTEPPRARAFAIKLANFERVTGLPLRVRIQAHAPVLPSAESSAGTPAGGLRPLAVAAGVRDQGAFLLHVTESDSWSLYAPSLSPAAREALLRAVAARIPRNLAQWTALQPKAPGAVAGQPTPSPGAAEMPPAQRLKLTLDAWLDELCFAFEPRK